jgi:hypothetical protein
MMNEPANADIVGKALEYRAACAKQAEAEKALEVASAAARKAEEDHRESQRIAHQARMAFTRLILNGIELADF